MMPRPLAEAGQASNLASLPILDLANRGVQGDGYLDFTKDHSSVQLKWIPNQYTEFTFGGQDESRIQGISRTLEKFNIEAVALGRSVNTNPGVAGYVDLCEIWATGLKLESHQLRTKYNAYMSRMGLLRDEAERDGYALNLASEIDFRQFVRFAPDIRKGNLVLMDNGNLRAIWRDEQGARLGLQFLGGGMVQYVIFKRRRPGKPISRVAGRDTFEGLKQQIDAFALRSMLCE